MFKSGVYKIVSEEGHYYIGQSKNLEKRKLAHWNKMKCGRHENNRVQNVCNKYGLSSLRFEIICYCEHEELDEYEQTLLNKFYHDPMCMNLTSNVTGTGLRRPLSTETRKKISEANKGHIPWNKGVPRTEEVKSAISAANKGRKMTEEEKFKRRLSQYHPVWSEESKLKLSKSRMRRVKCMSETESLSFESVDACAVYMGLTNTTISYFLSRGKKGEIINRGKCKGYMFTFEEEV